MSGKPWENQDPNDKNLETLRQTFALENIMGANILTSAPAVNDLKEGQMRLAYVSGTLYKYTRYGNTLYRQPFTAV